MTREEDAARKKREFEAAVETTRPKVQKHFCPTCREIGVYTGMVKVQNNLYQVSFKCLIDHHWSVKVGTLEAHAIRPAEKVVPPPEPEPLVPPPLAEGTPPPLTPERAPTAPVLTSSPLCGACAEPVGVKYYAGVPTAVGKLDLCMKCWTAWESGAPPDSLTR